MPDVPLSQETPSLRPVRRSILFEQERLRDYLDTVEIARLAAAGANAQGLSARALLPPRRANPLVCVVSGNSIFRLAWAVVTAVSALFTLGVALHAFLDWPYSQLTHALGPGLGSSVGVALFGRASTTKK